MSFAHIFLIITKKGNFYLPEICTVIKKLLCLSVFYCQCRQQILITTAISRNATSFVCLYHSTLHWAISCNATPFVCTLYHSTLHCAICLYVHCTIQNYTEPFHTILYCLCIRCATWHLQRHTNSINEIKGNNIC